MSRQRKTEIESCGNTENHRRHTWRKPVGKKGWHLQQCLGLLIFDSEIIEEGEVEHIRGYNDGLRGASANYVVFDEGVQYSEHGEGLRQQEHAYSQRGDSLERILRNADWMRMMGSLY